MIEGVKENDRENCVDIAADICHRALNLPGIGKYIDVAHRLGPKRSMSFRPIVVRFIYHQDAARILARAHHARRFQLSIRPDYTKEVLRERVQMEKVHHLAYRDGKSTQLNGTTLWYNGAKYSLSTVLNAGLDVARISERKTRNTFKFYGRFSPLSNFHPVNLSYKNEHFSSADQLYHYMRAERADKPSLAVEILLCSDPVDCKALGRQVPADRNKDVDTMKTVISLKFSHSKFKDQLKKSGDLEQIECNPHDFFWGAGCSLDSNESDGYSGVNTLGKLLMEFRAGI